MKKVYGYGPARPAQKPVAKAAPKPAAKPQISQRDAYAKAMYGATKRGGSNGIGVGM